MALSHILHYGRTFDFINYYCSNFVQILLGEIVLEFLLIE